MSDESPSIDVLFASRAIESPGVEGGFQLLSDLAFWYADTENIHPHVFSSEQSDALPTRHTVYRRPGWNRWRRLEFMRALARCAGDFPVVHTAHVPTPSNIRILSRLAQALRPLGTRFVQTVTALPDASEETLRQLLWGDHIVCQTEESLALVRALHLESTLIQPWASPRRVKPNEDRRRWARERVGSTDRPLIVFPGEFARLGIGFEILQLFDDLIRSQPNIQIVLACRHDYAHLGQQLAALRPSNVASIGEVPWILSLLEAADVVIYPARSMTAKFQPPLVLMEALQLGTPVVAADTVAEIHGGGTYFTQESWPGNEPHRFSDLVIRALHDVNASIAKIPAAQAKHSAFEGVARKYAEVYRHVYSSVPGKAPSAGRAELVRNLTTNLKDEEDWAFQGSTDSIESWIASSNLKDLDCWVSTSGRDRLERLLREMGGITIARSSDPMWLMHSTLAVPVKPSVEIFDLTVGDLMVGPYCLCPESEIRTQDSSHGRNFVGWAAVADNLLRPILRGRILKSERVEVALTAWWGMSTNERTRFLHHVERTFGRSFSSSAHSILTSGVVGASVFRRLKRLTVLRTCSRLSHLKSSWRHRSSLLPTARTRRPLGKRTTGLLVVLIGTDGAGKTSTSDSVVRNLERLGLRSVRLYFGRTRGNLPGIGLIRRQLTARHNGADISSASHRSVGGRLQKFAAWYYSLEYLFRAWILVMPRVFMGRVAILDRYVYDLRTMVTSCGPSRLVESLAPRPHVLIHLDASAEILRSRKAERSLQEFSRQRRIYADVATDSPGKLATWAMRTDHVPIDEITTIVTGRLLSLAHRHHIVADVEHSVDSVSKVPRVASDVKRF